MYSNSVTSSALIVVKREVANTQIYLFGEGKKKNTCFLQYSILIETEPVRDLSDIIQDRVLLCSLRRE